MSVELRLLAMLALVTGSVGSVRAQEIPVPSFIDRSLGNVFGNGEPKQPGAYASPSASELVPNARDVGAPPLRPLERLEPIALPHKPGNPAMPKLDLPGLPAYAPQNMPSQDMLKARATLALEARLTKDGELIPNGLVWRLYSAIPAIDGRPMLIASTKGSTAKFEIPAGSYVLYVGFGRAGLVKRIEFTGVNTREGVVLNAGGLRLDAMISDGKPIDKSRLTFDVYTNDDDSESERDLIASNVPAGKVLRLNAGTYHVVSRYGSVNALVRADIHVEAGKLTDATLQQHAALVTMKLVREHGGEAIADTAWSVTTASGDPVRESVGAFPSMVLAAGDYVIVAKNRDKVYQRLYEVKPGENTDVEVLTTDVATAEPDGSGDEGSAIPLPGTPVQAGGTAEVTEPADAGPAEPAPGGAASGDAGPADDQPADAD